jgi:hypothetical protein
MRNVVVVLSTNDHPELIAVFAHMHTALESVQLTVRSHHVRPLIERHNDNRYTITHPTGNFLIEAVPLYDRVEHI